MSTKNYFGGVLESSVPLTYMANGTRIHTQELSAPFGNEIRHLKTLEFIDAETGEVTDEFYGGANDFNIWFTAKAARGDRFNVRLHSYNDSPKNRIPYDEDGVFVDCIRTEYGITEQMGDGSWQVA